MNLLIPKELQKQDVLDHGYVKYVEHWGADEQIIEAARMSTDKGFLGWACWKCKRCGIELAEIQPHTSKPGIFCEGELTGDFDRVLRDEKLLRYLYEHKHDTPFEMAGAIIEVAAPIMVFREWHRHRTQSYNEMSGRYIALPNINYLPDPVRSISRSQEAMKTSNRQASGAGPTLEMETAIEDIKALEDYYDRGQILYDRLLAHGWPKELARLPTTVGRYSRMRASANLRNWLGFLTLRTSTQAQEEIRLYAKAVEALLVQLFPRTMDLFKEGKRK